MIKKIDLRPDTQKLRQFGFIVLVAFGILGGLVLWKRGFFGFDFGSARYLVAWILWGAGLLSLIFSLLVPRANLPLYVGLTLASFPIGYFVSYLVLGLLFYLIITPVGLLFRILGRDPLNRKFDPDLGSYWVPHHQPHHLERYFKQF